MGGVQKSANRRDPDSVPTEREGKIMDSCVSGNIDLVRLDILQLEDYVPPAVV